MTRRLDRILGSGAPAPGEAVKQSVAKTLATLVVCVTIVAALLAPPPASAANVQRDAAGPSVPASPAATAAQSYDLLVIGDSLTAGLYALRPDRGYFKRTAAWLAAHGHPTSLAVGAPEGTVASVLAHPDLLPTQPVKLAIIELGTNDARTDGSATPLADFERDYRALMDEILQTSPEANLILLGVWGQDPVGPAYDQVISTVAAEYGATFIGLDNLAVDPEMRGPLGVLTTFGLSDAFHPNDLGHAQIAQRLRSAIAPLYRLHATPPRTAATRLPLWSSRAAAVQLTPTPGSARVSETLFRVGAGPWRSGTAFRIHQEGRTTVRYYSLDRAGNMEQVRRLEVRIDSVAPTTAVAGPVTAYHGQSVSLGLTLTDPSAPVCGVHLQILKKRKTVADVRIGRLAPGRTTVTWPCTLRPGTYLYRFTAVDLAGNTQSSATAASLTVL